MEVYLKKRFRVKQASDKNHKKGCCVNGCKTTAARDPGVSFHNVPAKGASTILVLDYFGNRSKVDRRAMWMKNLKLSESITPNMRVCSKHFKKTDFATPNKEYYGKRFLNKWAVPTENLPESTAMTKTRVHAREQRTKLLNECRKVARSDSSSTSIGALGDNSSNNELLTYTEAFNENEFAYSETSNIEIVPSSVDVAYQLDPAPAVLLEQVAVTHQRDSSVQVGNSTSVRDVQTQACTNITHFIQSDHQLHVLTGLASFEFLDMITECYKTLKPDARQHKLSIQNRILLTFLKIKLDLSYAVLSVLFDCISPNTCKRVFLESCVTMQHIFQHAIRIPSKEEVLMNMPKCFDPFQNVRLVFDCTEVPLQQSKRLCCRLKCYSHYKKTTTLKFMTAVSPSGTIAYISKAYGGRSSDKAIFEQSKILEHLLPYSDAIMVDKGFMIDGICSDYAIKLIRPPFLRKKKQLTAEESHINVKIAAARVHTERTNAKIKSFKMLSNKYPIAAIPIADAIFTIVCGLTNLSSPILKDDKFLT